jgi:hypothetical protein
VRERLSLLGVVLRSDAIGIVGANALHQARANWCVCGSRAWRMTWRSCYTRYGIVSRAGYRLSPLAEAMIEQIKAIDAVDEEVFLKI